MMMYNNGGSNYEFGVYDQFIGGGIGDLCKRATGALGS